MRGSGNLRTPQPDVLVRTPVEDHAIELKRSSIDRGERTTFLDQSQSNDVQQLVNCSNKYTRIYAAMKFTNCEMVCVEVDPDNAADSVMERLPHCFEASATGSGNVRIQKPENTDVWPSATAGKHNVEVICDTLGVGYTYD